MASRGRPVERPAHLSEEQRRRAQEQTKQWRDQCGLSQRDMATAIGVSYASYRPWENGRDNHAGPTRLQTEQLDKALRRLLRAGYTEDGAFDVWGWPRQQDLSYDRVTELLRLAGFEVPRLQANGRHPAGVFWVHKVQSPGGVDDSVITLGGGDERALWEAWHRGCSDDLSARVRHIYLRPMPMPSYRAPWQERAIAVGTDRSTLTTYVSNRTSSDRADLLEWMLRTAVRLPAMLTPGFDDGLDPVLRDVTALLRAPAGELPTATVSAMAEAVVQWLNV